MTSPPSRRSFAKRSPSTVPASRSLRRKRGPKVAGGLATACSGDAWLEESNPSVNHFFEPRLGREIRSSWYVSASRVDATAQLLDARAIVAITPERAAPLLGRVPEVAAGESLYLIRAIGVADPAPLRIYQVGAWVEVSAGTHSTCFIFRPPMGRQPVVVALPQTPSRLRLSYSCDG